MSEMSEIFLEEEGMGEEALVAQRAHPEHARQPRHLRTPRNPWGKVVGDRSQPSDMRAPALRHLRSRFCVVADRREACAERRGRMRVKGWRPSRARFSAPATSCLVPLNDS